jgi:hypothetical protein
MTGRLAAAIAVAVTLLAPSGAAAGGFATVGVDPLPNGIGPGKSWQVQLTILQHGRTPLEGVDPRVIVQRGSERRTFAAIATRQPGVYRARVVFPSVGTWRYVVDDGFTARHTFPPVRVRAGGDAKASVAAPATPKASLAGEVAAPPSGAGSSGDGPEIVLALLVAAVAGLAAALASAALRRSRTRTAPEGG